MNTCFGQESSVLRGNIYDIENKPIDYFNVTLLLSKDSSFVKGGAFVDGYFELNNLAKQTYLLKLSCVQYLSKDTLIQLAQDNMNLGVIHLDGLTLSEVVVAGRKPFFKQELGVTKLDVKNSFLKDAGSLIDVLKKSPGVDVDYTGKVSVFGKGSPIIFINNKEVRSREEIRLLESNNIESIEIDRNPSAEYSASGHAIIKVKTKKQDNNSATSLSLSDYIFFGRKISNQTNVNIQYNNNKFSNFLSLSYQHNSLLQYDKNTQLNVNRNDTILNVRQGSLEYTSTPKNIFYSMEYQINKMNTLGFQYSGTVSNSTQEKDNTQSIFETNENDKLRDIDISNERNNYLHNFSVNYNLKLNKNNTLLVIGDYAFSKNVQNELILEEDLASNYSTQSNSTYDDNYKIMGVRADFNSNLNFLSYKLGTNYLKIINNGNSSFDEKLYSTKINDQVTALFFTVDKSFESFTVKAGIRGEYTFSNVNFHETNNFIINTNYFNLFPSLLLAKKFSDKVNISLSYSKRITRPNLNQLNPRFRYLDSLSYIVGNSKLNPAFTNTIELNTSVYNWSASIGYNYRKGQIVNVGESDAENQNIIKYTFINLNKSEYLTGSINYSYNSKKISTIAGIYVSKPFISIPYLGRDLNLNNPIWRISANIDYNLLKNSYLYCSFNYKSSGESGLTYFKESSNLSLGARQYLFNKKLQISFGVEDLLKTYKPNDWVSTYGNIVSTMNTDADSRTFYIKLRYDFGNLKMKNQKKSANTENLNRL
jgi:outer membrane receptor protein involved in Fe transport